MVLQNKYLISALFLFAALGLQADQSAHFINAAKHCLANDNFENLCTCLSNINTSDERQLEAMWKDVFNNCCAQKVTTFEKCLNEQIESGDAQAYYLSGLLHWCGCSLLEYEKDRVLAAIIFLELAEFLPKEEVRSFFPARRMLSKMQLTDEEKGLIKARATEAFGKGRADQLLKTLEVH